MIRIAPALAAALLAGLAPWGAQAQTQTPAELYKDNCSACHRPDGRGVKGAFPALSGNVLVQGDPFAVAAVVLKGRNGMPTFKDELTDAQLAAVLTYIRASWGNKGGRVHPGLISAARARTNSAKTAPKAPSN
jgi:mono/diheme cytochrome c family protein